MPLVYFEMFIQEPFQLSVSNLKLFFCILSGSCKQSIGVVNLIVKGKKYNFFLKIPTDLSFSRTTSNSFKIAQQENELFAQCLTISFICSQDRHVQGLPQNKEKVHSRK